MIQFPPPDSIWSTNDDRRYNPYVRAAKIRVWKEATWLAYKQAWGRKDQPPSIITIRIPVKDRRKRDPHNYCGTVLKAVIDGLVQAGAWPDDTPEYVGHREPVFEVHGELVTVTWSPFAEGIDNHEGVDVGNVHRAAANEGS